MSRSVKYIQPILITILYLSLGAGLLSGSISFFVYGCSILIEFVVLAILFSLAEVFGPSRKNQSSINVLVASLIMSLILYGIIYRFSKGIGEFDMVPLDVTAPSISVLVWFGNELLIIAFGVLISYGASIIAVAMPKRSFHVEGMLIRKALLIFGSAILSFIVLVILPTSSRLIMALTIVSVRLLLEIVEIIFDLKRYNSL